MENDLLFTLCTNDEWKEYSKSGLFEPESVKSDGIIKCYSGDQIEAAANSHFQEETQGYLIVIDPSRIQVPMKSEKEEIGAVTYLQAAFSIDAVIDRILLKKDPKKGYSVRVKHFD